MLVKAVVFDLPQLALLVDCAEQSRDPCRGAFAQCRYLADDFDPLIFPWRGRNGARCRLLTCHPWRRWRDLGLGQWCLARGQAQG